LRISSTVATAINRIMNKPSGPASPPDRVSPKLFSASTALSATTANAIACVTPLTLRAHPFAYPGEQVILRDRAVDERPGQLEVLGRPGLALDLLWHPEPEPVRIHLGRVSAQRLVTQLEVVGTLPAGGDPVALVAAP